MYNFFIGVLKNTFNRHFERKHICSRGRR